MRKAAKLGMNSIALFLAVGAVLALFVPHDPTLDKGLPQPNKN